MIVLDTLLIANGPNDGPIITGHFAPAEGDDAATLTLRTLISDLEITGDAALLLFNYYRQNGKRIDGAEYATISREAVETLDLVFSRDKSAFQSCITDDVLSRCRSIVKSLKVQVDR